MVAIIPIYRAKSKRATAIIVVVALLHLLPLFHLLILSLPQPFLKFKPYILIRKEALYFVEQQPCKYFDLHIRNLNALQLRVFDFSFLLCNVRTVTSVQYL